MACYFIYEPDNKTINISRTMNNVRKLIGQWVGTAKLMRRSCLPFGGGETRRSHSLNLEGWRVDLQMLQLTSIGRQQKFGKTDILCVNNKSTLFPATTERLSYLGSALFRKKKLGKQMVLDTFAGS